MQNKFLTMGLVVILAVAVGVGITVQQTNAPLLRKIVEQQGQILETQKLIAAQLGVGQTGSKQGAALAGSSGQQMAMMEKNVNTILAMLKGALRPHGPTMPQENYTKVYNIPIGTSYVRGNPHAPVTITEFADFECPFCARFHPVLDQVLAAFPNQVKCVIKNFPLPFHPMALPAAKAALAARDQGKYWEMAEDLLKNHNQLSSQKIQDIAKKIGLNMAKFNADLKNNDAKYTKIIKQDIALGTKVDVHGTPTFYINGRKTMARTLPQYKQVIDKILAKMKKK